jgi:hypothetical protein
VSALSFDPASEAAMTDENVAAPEDETPARLPGVQILLAFVSVLLIAAFWWVWAIAIAIAAIAGWVAWRRVKTNRSRSQSRKSANHTSSGGSGAGGSGKSGRKWWNPATWGKGGKKGSGKTGSAKNGSGKTGAGKDGGGSESKWWKPWTWGKGGKKGSGKTGSSKGSGKGGSTTSSSGKTGSGSESKWWKPWTWGKGNKANERSWTSTGGNEISRKWWKPSTWGEKQNTKATSSTPTDKGPVQKWDRTSPDKNTTTTTTPTPSLLSALFGTTSQNTSSKGASTMSEENWTQPGMLSRIIENQASELTKFTSDYNPKALSHFADDLKPVGNAVRAWAGGVRKIAEKAGGKFKVNKLAAMDLAAAVAAVESAARQFDNAVASFERGDAQKLDNQRNGDREDQRWDIGRNR